MAAERGGGCGLWPSPASPEGSGGGGRWGHRGLWRSPAPLRAADLSPQASSSEGGGGGGSSPTEEPALAFPLSEEERRELREAFELFDGDGSGLIDVSGLKARSRKNAASLVLKAKAVRFGDSSLVLIYPHEAPHCCIAFFPMSLGYRGENLVRNENLWS